MSVQLIQGELFINCLLQVAATVIDSACIYFSVFEGQDNRQ